MDKSEIDSKARLYGVSIGNGNDGVSRMYADYYVKTDDPWRLARLAAISTFKPGAGQSWAQRHVDVDGDADFGIYATLFNPPCEDTADGEYPDSDNPEDEEDGRNWSDGNGAWTIFEIFPEDEPRDGRPAFDSIEDAFSAEDLALVPSSLSHAQNV
jgi:hypothetical protein